MLRPLTERKVRSCGRCAGQLVNMRTPSIGGGGRRAQGFPIMHLRPLGHLSWHPCVAGAFDSAKGSLTASHAGMATPTQLGAGPRLFPRSAPKQTHRVDSARRPSSSAQTYSVGLNTRK